MFDIIAQLLTLPKRGFILGLSESWHAVSQKLCNKHWNEGHVGLCLSSLTPLFTPLPNSFHMLRPLTAFAILHTAKLLIDQPVRPTEISKTPKPFQPPRKTLHDNKSVPFPFVRSFFPGECPCPFLVSLDNSCCWLHETAFLPWYTEPFWRN